MGCLVQARAAFGATALSQVSMPGSLGAATYDLDPQSFDVFHGSACSSFTRSLVTQGAQVDRWHAAQQATLTEQLDLGSRFLELNVGYNGVPQPQLAWRVDNTLYSEQPLQDYLIAVAEWAKAHPTEVVVVDLRRVCADGAPAALQLALWKAVANNVSLATPGRGLSLSSVMYDAGARGAPALGRLTIDDVVHQRGGGHNVVLLVPSTVGARHSIRGILHADPYFVGPGMSTVAFSDTGVVPTATAGFASANQTIAHQASTAVPPIGSLAGKGLYVSPVAYDLAAASASDRATLFGTFGGLVTPYTPPGGTTLPAWESGLWPGGATPTAAAIATRWGHQANVVAVDGIDSSGVVPAVIALNGG
jgi:hypothetical protein